MNEPPSAAKSLHHIALGAHDVERVAAFYADAFCLPERTRHHYDDRRLRSIWLDLDGTILMIEHTDDPLRHPDGVGAGPFLLAFSVEGADERTAFEARLEALGAEIDERTQFTSYFRDPEGNRVAVSHYRGDE